MWTYVLLEALHLLPSPGCVWNQWYRWRLSPVAVSPWGPQLGFLPFPQPEAWAPSSATLFCLCVIPEGLTTPSWKWLQRTTLFQSKRHTKSQNSPARTFPKMPQCSDCTLDTDILYSAVNDHLWSYCMSELGREDGCNYRSVPLLGFKIRKTAQSASIAQLERLRNHLFPLGICAAWLAALERIRGNYSN